MTVFKTQEKILFKYCLKRRNAGDHYLLSNNVFYSFTEKSCHLYYICQPELLQQYNSLNFGQLVEYQK